MSDDLEKFDMPVLSMGIDGTVLPPTVSGTLAHTVKRINDQVIEVCANVTTGEDTLLDGAVETTKRLQSSSLLLLKILYRRTNLGAEDDDIITKCKKEYKALEDALIVVKKLRERGPPPRPDDHDEDEDEPGAVAGNQDEDVNVSRVHPTPGPHFTPLQVLQSVAALQTASKALEHGVMTALGLNPKTTDRALQAIKAWREGVTAMTEELVQNVSSNKALVVAARKQKAAADGKGHDSKSPGGPPPAKK